MSVVPQRVVVIQDASREISSSAIKWAIDGLSLKPGDELTLLGVLHQVNNPSTFPFMGAGKLMGYKGRVDPSSMLGANKKIIDEEVARKEEEYRNSTDILLISKLYEMKKIAFQKRVVPASSPKVVALQAAEKLQATWIILDRQMKKDKKYFMERLSCGISRMKRNNNVELLRGPKATRKNAEQTMGSQSSNVKYNEMFPETESEIPKMTQETPDEEDLFSLEFSPMKLKSPHRNRSNDEMKIDYGKGTPRGSAMMPSFSTSKSSENLSLASTVSSAMMSSFSTSKSSENLSLAATVSTPDERNLEVSSGFSFNEASHSPLRLQQEECFVSTQTTMVEEDSSVAISEPRKMHWVQSNETINLEQKQKQTNNIEEFLTYGSSNGHLEEKFKNHVCSECGNERPKNGWKRDFTYTELHDATNGFSTENFLSEGGFGTVYKGELKNKQRVAVKQHKHASLQGEKEFRSEVHVLSMARHDNVVMLLGSCSEGSHQLLVYEYVCNGSLNTHLSKHSANVLSWKSRMKIALGAARGLNYLHQNNIIHRDMRPNNILITHDYEPLLGDFGLAKTQHKEYDHSTENKVVGTFGYLAPEYAERGRASTKTDVYSFGVVLLELITGRTTMDKTLKEKSLVGWARPLLKERKYPELIDERILDCHDVHQLFSMVSVAQKCLSTDPDKRPAMEKVEDALKRITDGGTVSGIEEFSPTRSSISSLPTDESEGEQETDIQESDSQEISSIRRIPLSEAFSTESSAQSSSTSLSRSRSSKGSFSGKGKSFRKKNEGIMGSYSLTALNAEKVVKVGQVDVNREPIIWMEQITLHL